MPSKVNLKLLGLALTSHLFVGCVKGAARDAQVNEGDSLTMDAPATTKDGQNLLYRLYCAKDMATVKPTPEFRIGPEASSSTGKLKFSGVQAVKTGSACIVEATTTGPKASQLDAAATNESRIYRSAPQTLGANRTLTVELTSADGESLGEVTMGGSASPQPTTGTGTGTRIDQAAGATDSGNTATATGNPAPGVTSTGTLAGNSPASFAPTTTQSGTSVPGQAPGTVTLQIIGNGSTECPAGKRFNTNPQVMACQ